MLSVFSGMMLIVGKGFTGFINEVWDVSGRYLPHVLDKGNEILQASKWAFDWYTNWI